MAPRPDRRTVLLAVPLAVLWLAGTAGGLLAPALIGRHALVLALLNPRGAYVAAAATQTSAWLFFPLCLVRLSLGDPFHLALGRRHGQRGLTWVEARSAGVGRNLRRAERTVRRVGLPMAALVPTGPVMAAAGVVGLPVRPALVLNVAGTFARLVALHGLSRLAPDLVVLAGSVAAIALPALTLVAVGLGAGRWALRRRAAAPRRRHPSGLAPAGPSSVPVPAPVAPAPALAA